MIKEEWRDVVGYEGNYKVSSTGKIMNVKRNRLLSPSVCGRQPTRETIVVLYRNNIQHSKSVARLVAEAFLPDYDCSKRVIHIDKDYRNNDISNLAMSSQFIDRKGTSSRNSTKVYCENNDKYYKSMTECSIDLGIPTKDLRRALYSRSPVKGYTIHAVLKDQPNRYNNRQDAVHSEDNDVIE